MNNSYFLVYVLLLASLSCNQSTRDTQVADLQEFQSPKVASSYLSVDTLIYSAEAASQVRIFSKEENQGEFVTILPSLGRGVEDYTEAYNSTLTTDLVETGYNVVLIQPRGIGKSTGDLTPSEVSMEDLANDLKSTLDSLRIEKLHVIGHAFGNRLARTFATLYTSRVDKLILLACGGNAEMNPEAKKCLRASFDLKLSDEERLKMIRCAFFAQGNDPSVWLGGWYPKLALAEINAATSIDGNFYKKAGGKQFLIVQATEDFIAPPQQAGLALKDDLGDQAVYVEVQNAGHALTSEQPEEVARHVIDYLRQ